MSKPVKNVITAAYKKRFAGIDGAVLINIRGIKSNDNNKLRAGLSSKKIKVTVVKNSLVKRAVGGTALDAITKLLDGPCAVVYGGESVVNVARELIAQVKDIPGLEFKGALMEGQLFPPDQVAALSKYPTKVEAQAQVVTLVLSPARKVVGQIVSAGRRTASLVKAVIEKKEKEGGAPAPAPA